MGKKKEDKITTKKVEHLSEIDGVGEITLEKLSSKGYDTLLSVAVASPSDIVETTGLTESKARKIIQTCRENLSFGFENAFQKSSKNNLKISTGSKAFDAMIGGGMSSGHITEAYARYGHGKSQLAHQLCISLFKTNPEYKSIYLDTENSFSVKRIREMSEGAELNSDDVLKSIEHVTTFNSDHQSFMTEQAETLIKNNPNIKLLIVDSVMNHFRTEFQGRGVLAERQHKIAKHIHKLHKIAMLYDVVVYVTNQVMDDPGGAMYGNPVRVIGGNVLGHTCKVIVYLMKTKDGIKTKLIDHFEMADAEIFFKITQGGITDA